MKTQETDRNTLKGQTTSQRFRYTRCDCMLKIFIDSPADLTLGKKIKHENKGVGSFKTFFCTKMPAAKRQRLLGIISNNKFKQRFISSS